MMPWQEGNQLAATHGLRQHRLYRVWEAMKRRCLSPAHEQFADYGGRGITVCAEWLHNFGAFFDWATSNGWEHGLTLDRIDNDRGYSPSNCRFATRKEQRANQRPRRADGMSHKQAANMAIATETEA